MKTKYVVIAGLMGVTLSSMAKADINLVMVNKVGKNLYQSSDGKFIETSGCYAEAENDKAVLVFEKYACNNTIRFSSKKMCEVLDVYREANASEVIPESQVKKLKTGI